MTNIGFDLRGLQEGFKAHKKRGIGVYIRNLAARMRLAPRELSMIPFHDPGMEAEEPLALGSEAYDTRYVGPLRPMLRQYVWQHFLFRPVIAAAVKKRGLDAFFFPSHLDAPAGISVPYAVKAHDLIQAAMGEMHSSLKHRAHVMKQISALRGARVIIANSHHTKSDVVKYAGVAPEKIVVAHLGVDRVFTPQADADLSRFNLPEKFILNVGGIDPRKNINLLFTAFSKLLERDPDYHLLMTGALDDDPKFRDFTEELERRSLKSRARALGYVTQSELAALYARADLFFYPSLYEGFGLPVLEAMACGAPVITTDRSSIPEVAGDAALTLDPDQPELFTEALLRLAGSKDERDRLRELGPKRAATFSWDSHALIVWDTLAKSFG
ncbi:MAG: glycosyltransferase family 4 protein [Nitrospinota bacterium]|nr:glycosyltransferase family 4 protein [Nitrospinota bacterium]